jgi:hypothetical protein
VRLALGPLALAAVLAQACSGEPAPAAARKPSAPAAGEVDDEPPMARPPTTTADRIAAIARLVGHSTDATWVEGWAAKLAADPAAYGAMIDEMLRTPSFGREVVPTLMLGGFLSVRSYYALPSGFVLQQDERTGVHFLREPCSAEEAAKVAPWWDLSSEILLCPDSYRPEKWTIDKSEHAYRSEMPLVCDSQVGSPELENKPICGCGPNAIRCSRDQAQWEAMNTSLRNELRATTAWNVEAGRPVAELFTSNETFRDRLAETYYRRQEIGAKEIADVPKALAGLDAWPEGGQRAPRKELFAGQHAGLLTTPQILHALPDRRQRQRGYDELMWCAHKNSFGATTKRILDLNKNGNLAFVHDSWQTLANTPLCTNCHARLDFGFQFFYAYPDSRASTYAIPSQRRTGKGPMYVRDIQDPRGEAELTPAAYATMATAQPEFEDCVTQQVVGYVLGTEASADDVAAVRAAVAGGRGSVRDIVRTALMRLEAPPTVAAAEPAAVPAPTPAAPSPPPGHGAPKEATPGDAATAAPATAATATPATVALAAPLRELLDDTCVGCHDEVAFDGSPDSLGQAFDLRGEALPRKLLVRMLERVAFRQMPPKGMPAAARRTLVDGLIDALWSEPAARAEARAHFVDRGLGLPAQLIDEALDSVLPEPGKSTPLNWGAIERAIWVEQATVTPGYLATVALEALRGCKPHRDGELRACLDQRFVPERLVRRPPTVAKPVAPTP